MTAAREYDSVRTTAGIVSDDGRTVPAGMTGAVVHARPGGSILAGFAFAPQTAGTDGDFVHGVLTRDQYEVIQDWPVSVPPHRGTTGSPERTSSTQGRDHERDSSD
jgi:hypothetical protein